MGGHELEAAPRQTTFLGFVEFWRRLRTRKVAQWGAAYVVLAFGLLQGVSFVRATLELPSAIDRVALVLLAAGLPIVLIVAWRHGDRGHQNITRWEAGLVSLFAAAGLGGALFVSSADFGANDATRGQLPRLAVLRFDGLGADPDFAEGVADELISEVSRVHGMEVTARASSFALTGENATPAAAARELGATLVLTGSARRTSDAIRVHAQLAAAPSGQLVWDRTFERPTAEAYALQRDIAVEIARAAGVSIDTPVRPVAPEALTLYQQARALWYKRVSEADTARARDLFQEAVNRDPTFAAAWGWLSYAEYRAVAANFDRPNPPPLNEALFARSLDAADRAQALDAQQADVYETREWIYGDLGRWKEAEAAGDASAARGGLAYWSRVQTGQVRRAMQAIQRQSVLDPLNVGVQIGLSDVCGYVGDRECAVAAGERAVELADNSGPAMFQLFIAYWASGDRRRARALIEGHTESWRVYFESAGVMDRRFLLSIIDDAAPVVTPRELIADLNAGKDTLGAIVYLFGLSGHAGEAAPLLTRWAIQDRPNLAYLYSAPLAPLRRTPQFWALMEREGLVKFWRESGHWPDFCAREHVCPQ